MATNNISGKRIAAAAAVDFQVKPPFKIMEDNRRRFIRIDIDAHKLDDRYPAALGIHGDAGQVVDALISKFAECLDSGGFVPSAGGADRVKAVRARIADNLSGSEPKHAKVLQVIRATLDEDAIVMGDATQITYSASTLLPFSKPRCFHYAAGYCALGFAFPNAIGAKLAMPKRQVIAMAGDGGSMFTIQELVTAAELKLPIPLVLWHNNGYQQIRDDMRAGNYPRVAVDGLAPDFEGLAKAMHCHAVRPESAESLAESLTNALLADRPTLIVVHEDSAWLS